MATTKNTASHAKYYWMEAAGLGGFVLLASLVTIFLEHPELPVMQTHWKDYPLLRRVPLGIIMGCYIMLITVLFGKKSGAQINPAVTWSFYYLKKISFKDAALYTAAQFIGAIAAAQILKHTLGYWFSHPAIDYSVTQPKPQYSSLTALTAEAIISFVLMFVVLTASASKKWDGRVPLLSGILIALFIIFEMPFSGMSLNPARSTAGDLAALKFEHLWLYFVSPLAAMLLASKIFERRYFSSSSADKKDLPVYPVD